MTDAAQNELTYREAAKALGVHRNTIRAMVCRGALASVGVLKHRQRIERAEIERVLELRKKGVTQ
jgi:excisionase family DNA binding protein